MTLMTNACLDIKHNHFRCLEVPTATVIDLYLNNNTAYGTLKFISQHFVKKNS